MYLSWFWIIVALIIIYQWGYSVGKSDGKQEGFDIARRNPELTHNDAFDEDD